MVNKILDVGDAAQDGSYLSGKIPIDQMSLDNAAEIVLAKPKRARAVNKVNLCCGHCLPKN